MKRESTMLLIGVGGAGARMARDVDQAFGGGIRHLLADTDAATGDCSSPFILLGGDRLAGRGAGGDIVSARLAAEETVKSLDESLEGVRLAVVLASLGGGTGGGATLEILKHLDSRGIPSIVFATTPFTFEGEDRHRNARGVMTMISETASASFFLPLDKLAGGETDMAAAMRRAISTLADGITLFWRLVEKPGYIRLDVERIRRLAATAGLGRFASVSMQGPGRAAAAVEALARSPLLADGTRNVRTILCGVLAGDDLRLAEVGEIAEGLKTAFGRKCSFELATVNDERAFGGRLSVVAMLFETDSKADPSDAPPSRGARKARAVRAALASGPHGRGRFNNSMPTIWNGEDLDIPTYLRYNINLEF